jgi:hypothetical protein
MPGGALRLDVRLTYWVGEELRDVELSDSARQLLLAELAAHPESELYEPFICAFDKAPDEGIVTRGALTKGVPRLRETPSSLLGREDQVAWKRIHRFLCESGETDLTTTPLVG